MRFRGKSLPEWLQHALVLCAVLAAGITIFTIYPITGGSHVPGKIGDSTMWPIEPETVSPAGEAVPRSAITAD